MDTITGNILIGEFMERNKYEPINSVWFFDEDKQKTIERPETQEDYEYHTSWDWQVPAWSKVIKQIKEIVTGKLNDDEKAYQKYLSFLQRYDNAVFDNTPNIGHAVLIEAIQWYNTQTPNNGKQD